MTSYVLVEFVSTNENNKTEAWILTGSSQPVLKTYIAIGKDISVHMTIGTLLSQTSRADHRAATDIGSLF